MDNFNEIIKQKVEQFEVPYNEAHWAEMDGKLNSIRSAKIKNNIFGSAAILAVVAISSYFIFSEKDTAINDNSNINTEESTPAFIVSNETPLKVDNPIQNNNENTKVTEIINEAVPKENNSEVLNVEATDFTYNKGTENAPDEQEKKSNNKVVTNDNSINSEFFVFNNKVCLGEAVSFEASENDEPISYTWNFGDGTISHKVNPKHIYEDSHLYSVSLTLLNRQTGKEYTSIQEDIVTIMAKPKASFSYAEVSVQHDDNKLKHPYTTFKIKDTSKKNTYSWDFGNGETSKSNIAKTIYKKKGSYTTTLTVKNSLNGCVNIVEEKIDIKQGIELFAPNTFTPNGNGGNETFIPKALLGWDVQFEMTVIDKAGTLIYKTSDKSEPWNGKLNNSGNILKEGVYMWQVIIYDAEGSPHRYQDQILLMK
jgi:gliding motility-associated-like protein